MKIIDCPLNGERNISEFMCYGEVQELPSTDDNEAWVEYVFMENNRAGVVFEWWMHMASCYWFIVERNTVTEEIIRTYEVEEFMLEIKDKKAQKGQKTHQAQKAHQGQKGGR